MAHVGYVTPKDPIVQSIKSKPRLQLRLPVKLLSQVSEFGRQPDLLDMGTLPHIIRFPERQLFRNGRFLQAAHFPSYSAYPQQGPLAPPCFQGFLATMGLSDSHMRQTSRLFIPSHPSALHRATVGLPGSSVHLSARAFPYHPEAPYRCTCPLLPCRFQASPHPAGWPHPLTCNEAEIGSLSLRLTRSWSRGPTSFASHLNGGDRPASRDRLPSRRGPPLHGEQAITMANSFQLARRTRLGLAHRMTRINTDSLPERKGLFFVTRHCSAGAQRGAFRHGFHG